MSLPKADSKMFCVTVTTLPGGLQNSHDPSLSTAFAVGSEAATWLLPKFWPVFSDRTPAKALVPPMELSPCRVATLCRLPARPEKNCGSAIRIASR